MQEIAAGLGPALADTYTRYLKTHNFHSNVTGPRFRELHLMFEEEYGELWLATDLIAERIRALGEYATATYREFAALSSIAEPEGVPAAEAMVTELLADHEAVVRTGRRARCSRSQKAHPTRSRWTCSRSACKSMRRRPGCCGASDSSRAWSVPQGGCSPGDALTRLNWAKSPRGHSSWRGAFVWPSPIAAHTCDHESAQGAGRVRRGRPCWDSTTATLDT
jgi:DNA-binding ferritin-like protein